jgi:hypothetical protein
LRLLPQASTNLNSIKIRNYFPHEMHLSEGPTTNLSIKKIEIEVAIILQKK